MEASRGDVADRSSEGQEQDPPQEALVAVHVHVLPARVQTVWRERRSTVEGMVWYDIFIFQRQYKVIGKKIANKMSPHCQ